MKIEIEELREETSNSSASPQ